MTNYIDYADLEDRLDRAVERGELTEEEAREEFYEAVLYPEDFDRR